MNNAYAGRFLFIDLTRREVRTQPVPDTLKDLYIGGKGFGAKLLAQSVPPGTDPLSPDNVLMFMTGPLTGTAAPAMRGCVVFKSPLTHLFSDSYFGGSFSHEIKYAGYDGIIISGRADTPVYLWIDDDHVEIRDAAHLWGTDILETGERIKAALKDDTVKTAVIGPAGEHQVPFALIGCEFNRQAGRAGGGAVMGSKNLKAVAVRGTRLVRVHDPRGFARACDNAVAELAASPDVQTLTQGGTAASVEFASETGLLPGLNYQYGTFEKAAALGDQGQRRHLWLGTNACMGCPIGCARIGAVRTGKYKGLVSDIVEYESAALMGSNLGISDVRAVALLVKSCDLLGLDTMSCGSIIGFAMEACKKGLIASPAGMDLDFGNVAAAQYLIDAMAHRKEGLGALLSKGVKAAALEIGGRAKDMAQHTKGLETPAWGPRGVSGMGLAYMTADRGGCHQRGFTVPHELAGEWSGKKIDPLSPEGKADMVIALQNYSAGTDTLVKCDFGTFGISAATYADLLSAATGRQAAPDIFDQVGERIWNLTRRFNLAHGMDPAEDTLPRRFVQEPLPDGPARGHKISETDMAVMRRAYYLGRGWDASGVPEPATLNRLMIEP
jgi:aldehyde:ferredoxin oxidoreductase